MVSSTGATFPVLQTSLLFFFNRIDAHSDNRLDWHILRLSINTIAARAGFGHFREWEFLL